MFHRTAPHQRDSSRLPAQADFVGAEFVSLLDPKIPPVRENRDELECAVVRKPFLFFYGFSPTLQLGDDLRCMETPAFQLDKSDPGFGPFLTDENVIAPLPATRNVQFAAIEIDQYPLHLGYTDGKLTAFLIARLGTAPVGNSVGDGRNEALHPPVLSCARLKMVALSLYSASPTTS